MWNYCFAADISETNGLSCAVLPAAVRSRLLRLRSLWDEIRQRAEEREGKLQDVLDLAGKFWADMAALLSTLRDSQEIVKELEDPGVDPSLIKQQIEAAEVRMCILQSKREIPIDLFCCNIHSMKFNFSTNAILPLIQFLYI